MKKDDRRPVRAGKGTSGGARDHAAADPRHGDQHGGPGRKAGKDGEAEPSARRAMEHPNSTAPADGAGAAKDDADGGPGVQSNPSAPYGVQSEPAVSDPQSHRDPEPDAQLPPQSDERWQKYAGSDGEGSGRMRASAYGYGGGPFVAEEAPADDGVVRDRAPEPAVDGKPLNGEEPGEEDDRAGANE